MSWAVLAQILSMAVPFKNRCRSRKRSRRVAITPTPSQATCQSHLFVISTARVWARCNRFPLKRGLFSQSQKNFCVIERAAVWRLTMETLVNDQIEVAESVFSVQKVTSQSKSADGFYALHSRSKSNSLTTKPPIL